MIAIPAKNEMFLILHMDCDHDHSPCKKMTCFSFFNRTATMIAVPAKNELFLILHMDYDHDRVLSKNELFLILHMDCNHIAVPVKKP